MGERKNVKYESLVSTSRENFCSLLRETVREKLFTLGILVEGFGVNVLLNEEVQI